MFQSMFIIIFLIGAIDGGIIQPQTFGLENWQTEDKLHEMDGINVTGKPSELSPNILDELHTFISAILRNEVENGPNKRHIENDPPETDQGETIEQKKWRTFLKLHEHIRLYGECKRFMNQMEQFFNNAIEKAKMIYGDSAKWFLTREIVDGIGTQKNLVEGQNICKTAMDALDEASKTGEYPGLIQLAKEKVHEYFVKLEADVKGLMMELE